MTDTSHALARVFQATFCAALLGTAGAAAEQSSFAEKRWPTAVPANVGLQAASLEMARAYALSGGGSGHIVRHGKLVLSWGDPKRRYDLKSTTKSIGVTALGLAIADGKMKLPDKACDHHPELRVPPGTDAPRRWLEEITLLHLATQTAGFEKPGGYGKLLFRPGTRWHYSDGGPNWLAECVTLVYGRDVNDVMFQRVFTPLGISSNDLTWRNNAYRKHKIGDVARREFGSGIHANVDAMARIGYLYLREGRWRDRQLLPASFVDAARQTVPSVVGLPEHDPKHGNASDHYGLLWWNNADGTLKNVPRDAYWSWGLYESLILVIPSLDIVASRAGKSWPRKPGGQHYDVLAPFFEPIVAAVINEPHRDSPQPKATPSPQADGKSPYPPSPVITELEWAAPATTVRKAQGSDNWPITWGDDGHLYTAYGDGWGFEPRVPRKLSLGLARIRGGPEDFAGENIRSKSAEQYGDGPRGKKASGMLMVDGVLYMWVRNAENSQLARSADRGRTWQWMPWKMTTSFGCPTFLNFGRNYAGARDGYVYTYSFDSDSAYRPADRMVLARVTQTAMGVPGMYEYFTGIRADGQPVWSRMAERRGAVFTNPGRCYRSQVSYNAPLKRYLWVQVIPDGRGKPSGLGVFDAPEPWGPWTTVFYTKNFDDEPGETAGFPTKWMSEDGRTLYLVSSSRDTFAVRRATLLVAQRK